MSEILAAVIEWPEDLSDAEPALILAHTEYERNALILAELLIMAGAISDREWRDAIQNTGGIDWREWLEAMDDAEYGRPFVSLYTKESPA